MNYLSIRKKKEPEKVAEMRKETLNQRSVVANSIEEDVVFRV